MKTTKNKQTTYSYKTMKSPVGRLKLVASERGLAAILWENDDPKRVRLAPLVEDKSHPVLRETERQLNDYFAGKLKKFSLRFDFAGTEFQRKYGGRSRPSLSARPAAMETSQDRSGVQKRCVQSERPTEEIPSPSSSHATG